MTSLILLTLSLGYAAETRVPWVGGDRIRVEPELAGLPVLGATAIYAETGGAWRLRGGRELPALKLESATWIAEDVAVRAATAGVPLAWTPRAHRAVWAGAAPTWVWAVDYGVSAPFGTFRALVDAASGEVLQRRPTHRSALGLAYPENPVVTPLSEVELRGLDDSGALSGAYADVFSCAEPQGLDDPMLLSVSCEALERQALPDEAGDYLYPLGDDQVEDPLSEVSLYYHLDRVSRYAETTWGFRHSRPMRGIVNFPLANAFWGDFDGDGAADISFGHEGPYDFAYDGDVVYHEFGHSIVHGVIPIGFVSADAFGMRYDPGALDEGSADTVALLLTSDPDMADFAGGILGNGLPIRALEEPRRCPDDLFGESHEDGMVWGTMIWQMLEDPALGREATAQLWYGAMSTWGEEPTWEIAGASLLTAASELHSAGILDAAGLDAVQTHVSAAGLDACGRVVPLDGGVRLTQWLFNAGLAGDYSEVPLGMQFSIEVPEGASALKLQIPALERYHEDLGFAVYVRHGAPVEHEVKELPSLGLALAVPRVYDAVFTGDRGGWTQEITASTAPALSEGTWYFSVASHNLGGIAPMEYATGAITVSAEVVLAAPEEPEEKGCAAVSSATLGAWALGMLAIRRRRGAPTSSMRTG